MKIRKIALCAAAAANFLPLAVAFLLYRYGLPVELPVFLLASVLLSVLNYAAAKSTRQQVILSVLLVLAVVAAGVLSLCLYLKNVSSDNATVVVGTVFIIVNAALAATFSGIAVIVRLFLKRKPEKTEK